MVTPKPDYEEVYKRLMENERILEFTVTTAEERKRIETEKEAWRTIDAFSGGVVGKIFEQIKLGNEKDKLIEELRQKLAGK